jgi:hypothetical protein
MRSKFGIAAAVALSAMMLPAAAQAQYYYGPGYGDRSDYGRGYSDYYGDHDRRDWRDRERWERRREREEWRAHRRWERHHRHHYYRDYDWNPYR